LLVVGEYMRKTSVNEVSAWVHSAHLQFQTDALD
jgi:hypothetical protein